VYLRQIGKGVCAKFRTDTWAEVGVYGEVAIFAIKGQLTSCRADIIKTEAARRKWYKCAKQ
jgi:hypothetical protein